MSWAAVVPLAIFAPLALVALVLGVLVAIAVARVLLSPPGSHPVLHGWLLAGRALLWRRAMRPEQLAPYEGAFLELAALAHGAGGAPPAAAKAAPPDKKGAVEGGEGPDAETDPV